MHLVVGAAAVYTSVNLVLARTSLAPLGLRSQRLQVLRHVAALGLALAGLVQPVLATAPALAPLMHAGCTPVVTWLFTQLLYETLGIRLDVSLLVQPQLVEVMCAVLVLMFSTLKVAPTVGVALSLAMASIVAQQWFVVLVSPPVKMVRGKPSATSTPWDPLMQVLTKGFLVSKVAFMFVTGLVGTAVLPANVGRLLWSVTAVLVLILGPQVVLQQLMQVDRAAALVHAGIGSTLAPAPQPASHKTSQAFLDACWQAVLQQHVQGSSTGNAPVTAAQSTTPAAGAAAPVQGAPKLTDALIEAVSRDLGQQLALLKHQGLVQGLLGCISRDSGLQSKVVAHPDLGPALARHPQLATLVPHAAPAAPTATAVAAEAQGQHQGDASWQELVLSMREHASDVAHDLKNPLSGVLALTQTVMQGTFGDIPTAAADQLGVVRSCGYHLLNMINNLRDVFRGLNMADIKLSLGVCQLASSSDEVVSRMQAMVGTRFKVVSQVHPSQCVYAEADRLHQAVHVVIANAFKYTRRGCVTLDSYATEDGQYAALRVTDTGTGLSAEQLARFNSPLDGSCAEQLGLGLHSVRRLMAHFGGQLRIANATQGKGAVVELVFRTTAAAAPLTQAALHS